MSDPHYDVIVIGAGLGGLAAAARLAQARKRVLVLEHHSVPGGYAHEFRRGKYRFEVSLHALDGAAPGGWAYDALKSTGVLDRICLHRLDPFYIFRAPGVDITAHADAFAYESELVRQFPEHAAGIRALFDASLRAFIQTRRLLQDRAADRIAGEQIPGRYPEALAVMGQSLAEFIKQFVDDPRVIGAFSALWGYYGLPPSQLNAATFVMAWGSYHLSGAYYPQGGSMALSRALEAVIAENGSEIRYQHTVTKIGMSNGRATGVETHKGLKASADLIVANSNAPDTFLKLIGREHLPDAFAERLTGQTLSLSNVVVYLGLNRDVTRTGWPHHECYLSETCDPEADYNTVLSGDWARVPLAISNYSAIDDAAPEGGSVLSLFALAPMDYQNQWGTGGVLEGYQRNAEYARLKEAMGNTLIARAEKFIPGLRESIVHKEIATPLTNIRYSLNPGGAIYGFAQSVDQAYAGRLSHRTPIDNLFLAGAWTNPGGGMSAALMSGVEAARLALAHFDRVRLKSMFTPVDLDVTTSALEEAAVVPSSGNGHTTAPDFTLDVIGAARKVSLHQMTGRSVILVFNSADTAAQANAINNDLRVHQPDHCALPILTVVDLHGVPRLFRGAARSSMQKSFAEAVRAAQDTFAARGVTPADMTEVVCILPDWDGTVTSAFDVGDVGKQAAAVLIGSDGTIVARASGEHAAEEVWAALKRTNQPSN